MNATTLPRLPKPLTVGGAQVALRLPLEDGAVAHKPLSRRIDPESKTDFRFETFAACAPDDDPCAELSAAWADWKGAQACTEPACFPDAEPR